ncbi:MAG TPA: FAD-dependent oxidoreductase [Nevskiaceae bacterium]|nr:FAD-dependent oxidoreductase [Nevskiaceae bacterium]
MSAPVRPRLVLVGNGMAGVRTLEELLARAPDAFDITVIGAEPHGNYNRILLSPVLAGEKTVADVITHAPEWYAERGIQLHVGDAVAAIDPAAQTVSTRLGRRFGYDRLLLATGSKPFILPVPGKDLEGVVSFRDIADVERMIEAARTHRRAAVIGGGLLGLECANGLAQRGMDVTVVHLMDTLMERQLDAAAARLLQTSLEARGLKFRLPAATEALLGDGRVEAIRFKDGSTLDADLVVMAAGIQPNTELARGAGLACERGVVVDDTMRTSDPHVFAVGECVQHRQVCYGLVSPLWEQARVCAAQLAGEAGTAYEGSLVYTRLKVTGIDLFSAGNFLGGEGCEDIVLRDPRRGVYRKLVLREGRLEGAVLYGDARDGGWYCDLIRQRANVSHLRRRLVFGQRLAEAA